MNKNLDDLTIGEARELANIFGNSASKNVKQIDEFAIVILDKGFVHVGRLKSFDDDFLELTNAHNIRIWGTKQGLGELVLKGKLNETKLDLWGTIMIPKKSLITYHPTKEELWK
jgi:hypothetical protein